VPACVDCWDDRKQYVAATEVYEDSDLCLTCSNQRKKEHEQGAAKIDAVKPLQSDSSVPSCECGKPLRHHGACKGVARRPMVIMQSDIDLWRSGTGNHKSSQKTEAAKLLTSGESVRKTASATGLAKATVSSVRKAVESALPKTCECGEKLGHRGWCVKRFEKSPKRQEVMKRMHEKDEEQKNTASLAVRLKSGGSVRVMFSGNPLTIGKSDRDFLFSIIDRMQLYESNGKPPKENIDVTLTPKIARAIWSELTDAQKAKIIDVDDQFDCYDDDLRMMIFHKLTLLNLGDKTP